jgi:hypothetical protein
LAIHDLLDGLLQIGAELVFWGGDGRDRNSSRSEKKSRSRRRKFFIWMTVLVCILALLFVVRVMNIAEHGQ